MDLDYRTLSNAGAWRLQAVPLPPGIEPPLDLRAIATPERPESRQAPAARDGVAPDEAQRASRVVRLRASGEVDGVTGGPAELRRAP